MTPRLAVAMIDHCAVELRRINEDLDMSWTREDAEIEREQYEAHRLKTQCQCYAEMPGFCPGPQRCPLVDKDEDEPDQYGDDNELDPTQGAME